MGVEDEIDGDDLERWRGVGDGEWCDGLGWDGIGAVVGVVGVGGWYSLTNRGADRDDDEDDVDKHHEAIYVVELVVPERGEDEVHLDEDRTKRQDARQRNHDDGTRVPWGRRRAVLTRDRARDGVDSAREVVLAP